MDRRVAAQLVSVGFVAYIARNKKFGVFIPVGDETGNIEGVSV
jgi:hypothetical protein